MTRDQDYITMEFECQATVWTWSQESGTPGHCEPSQSRGGMWSDYIVPVPLEEWGRLRQPPTERKPLGEVPGWRWKCNLSHWKPQARFLVCGMWCQQGQGLLPVAERKEWREEEGTPPPSPPCTQALSTGSPPILWRQHDVMGRPEATPRAPLRQPSFLWAPLSSQATWEEEGLKPELPCGVDTAALWKWLLSQHWPVSIQQDPEARVKTRQRS